MPFDEENDTQGNHRFHHSPSVLYRGYADSQQEAQPMKQPMKQEGQQQQQSDILMRLRKFQEEMMPQRQLQEEMLHEKQLQKQQQPIHIGK